MKKAIFTIAAILIGMSLFSQETETKTDSLRKDALNVYMSANDYVKTEIPYVNYVRDLKDAGVYIISTSQSTGSGGREYTYYLTGQNEYEGMSDTISYITSPNETSEEIRQKQINTLKMGLMRYVMRTPLAQYMRISFTQPMQETVTTDKWNSWVFRTSLSTSLSGQQSLNSSSFYATISASRVTEDIKIESYANFNYSKSEYKTLSTTSDSKSQSAQLRIIKSINDHWSYGGSAEISSSTYSNYDASVWISPGLEYDLYPYSESTRQQLRILYQIGYNYANYTDTTRFFKTDEHLSQHSLTAAYQVIQKWGSINSSFSYRNYLHDWSLNNINFYTSLSFRIVKGLSLSLYGSYSIVHDQINLPKGNLTPEEILLRRRQQETSYSYSMSFGFSYTFGSIYNNVVNPRFGN